MKKSIKMLGILILSGFMVACGNQQSGETVQPAHDDAANLEHHEIDPHHNLTIDLNDGDRWAVNEEMKPHVEKGQEILQAYISSGDQDYKALAMEIDAENKKLISSCTMTGKSHDELHKWLHPHLELVKKLEAESDQIHANEIIEDLEVSYENYHKYFK